MSANTKVLITVASYWVNDFKNGCPKERKLDSSDNLAKGFASAMKSKGHQWKFDCDSSVTNPSQFIGIKSKEATGSIPYDDNDKEKGVDTIQFAYLVSHGAISFRDMPEGQEDIYTYFMVFGKSAPQFDEGKENKNKCLWINNTARLGNRNLQWLIVDGCHSCQLPGYFREMRMDLNVNPGKIWFKTFFGINMIFGFHDLSTDSFWIDDRGSDFGSRAGFGDLLADAWVEEAYSWWTKENPVALACGKTEKEANERLMKDSIMKPQSKMGHTDIKWMAYLWKSRTYKN